MYQWLNLAGSEELTKDQELFPGFDQALASDLYGSFDAFIEEVVLSEASDYRQLLQADWTYTTERLAEFYGDAWKPASSTSAETESARPDNEWLKRSVSDATQRSGALTHPLLTSRLAHFDTTSPIHRGVLLYRHILGRTLRPPNAAFAPLDADLHPDLTTRERIEMQTGDTNCQVCHQKINPLGFVLENYDAAGRYRSQDNGQPIDASGDYVDRDGERVKFDGARSLADYLANSDDCRRAFVEAAFEHFVKQPIAAYGPDLAEQLSREFSDSGCSIRQLIVNIAVAASRGPIAPRET